MIDPDPRSRRPARMKRRLSNGPRRPSRTEFEAEPEWGGPTAVADNGPRLPQASDPRPPIPAC